METIVKSLEKKIEKIGFNTQVGEFNEGAIHTYTDEEKEGFVHVINWD